ncbi:MAG TPA: hypothetical protein VLH35_03170 [Candidatus Acidoferrales bacterium]|nr:hypothetical protein [Candidatus Acidoferrales bacterium]
MRDRKTLTEEYGPTNLKEKALIETLLDIRQLLAIIVVHTESGATAATIRDVAKDRT